MPPKKKVVAKASPAVAKKAAPAKKKTVAYKPSTTKVMPEKVTPEKVVVDRIVAHKRNIEPHHYHMSGLLALVVGFASYAFISSFTSTNNYLDLMQTDVLNADGDAVAVVDTPAQSKENPFLDLPEDHPNKEAILALYYDGIVKGDDKGNFRPNDWVNRGEFAKIVAEAIDLDLTTVKVAENCFADVKTFKEHWFTPYVCAMKEKGLINGYAGNVFEAAKFINRAESLKVILEAFAMPITPNNEVGPSKYSDVKPADWFVGVAASAGTTGLISEGGVFDAGHQMTRAEVCQVVFNALQKPE